MVHSDDQITTKIKHEWSNDTLKYQLRSNISDAMVHSDDQIPT